MKRHGVKIEIALAVPEQVPAPFQIWTNLLRGDLRIAGIRGCSRRENSVSRQGNHEREMSVRCD